jgi:hypothetical protein
LAKYPAHNHNATVRSPKGTIYEITPSLKGQILFDFMGAADVIDLLQSVEVYLSKQQNHQNRFAGYEPDLALQGDDQVNAGQRTRNASNDTPSPLTRLDGRSASHVTSLVPCPVICLQRQFQ